MSSSQSEKPTFLRRLKTWQEDSSYLTMIGPHFGLSRDYDDFVLGLAPPLWALQAILMHDVPGATEYICLQMRAVLQAIDKAPIAISFFTALWFLHISASDDSASEYFEFGRRFVNERGSVPEKLLYQPIGMLPLEEEEPWLESAGGALVHVPDRDDFRLRLRSADQSPPAKAADRIAIALDALLADAAVQFWSTGLVHCLHH